MIILQILIIAIAVLITGAILPGIQIKSFWTAVLIAIVLALLNFFVYPVMVFLSIPITIITFGLFLFVINAVIIMLASAMIGGFKVEGFWWALIFSIVLSFVTYLLEMVLMPQSGQVIQ
jgi:putative membrane protein